LSPARVNHHLRRGRGLLSSTSSSSAAAEQADGSGNDVIVHVRLVNRKRRRPSRGERSGGILRRLRKPTDVAASQDEQIRHRCSVGAVDANREASPAVLERSRRHATIFPVAAPAVFRVVQHLRRGSQLLIRRLRRAPISSSETHALRVRATQASAEVECGRLREHALPFPGGMSTDCVTTEISRRFADCTYRPSARINPHASYSSEHPKMYLPSRWRPTNCNRTRLSAAD